MNDLTIIFLTTNKIPQSFAEFHKQHLLIAAKDYPIITVSREPVNIGTNIIDTGTIGYENIYHIMLRAAKLATTPYIAIAEDDTLYPPMHFEFYRPPLDTFAYNQNRFSLFNWGVPTYNWRNRKANTTLIAPRELTIEALEERFAKHPNGIRNEHIGELGRANIDKWLGVTVRKSIEVHSELSVIQINHDGGGDDRANRHRKALGPIKAFDIPHWGTASELILKYK